MYDGTFVYNLKIPEDFRVLFMWLSQDLAALYVKWNFYLGLFSSHENTELMSDLAQSSFQIIEEAIRSDLTMGICRLSDPPKSSGKKNLSIKTLVNKCENIKNLNLKESFDEFNEACGPIRHLRNKKEGHNDLNTKIKPKDNPLPGIGRKQIDKILNEASKILNVIYKEYVDSKLAFDVTIHRGGASDLLDCLEKAKEYRNKISNIY